MNVVCVELRNVEVVIVVRCFEMDTNEGSGWGKRGNRSLVPEFKFSKNDSSPVI